jgi:outer membrane protein OmpA-like peptidoglycan-associated protein
VAEPQADSAARSPATAAAPSEPPAEASPRTAAASEPAPASEAETAAQAPAAPAATQQSALPPASESPAEEQLARVSFGADSDDLDAGATEQLKSVVAYLEANPDARIQLLAYAAGSDSEVLKARRLSLARALSVRKYLVDAGIGSRRMDVRAQGNKAGEGPADRVDIVSARR